MAETEIKQPSPEKLKALQLALEKIEKDHGKGTIMKLGDDRVEDVMARSRVVRPHWLYTP